MDAGTLFKAMQNPEARACDGCDTVEYDGLPGSTFVEVRIQRPSDPSDLTCIMWGCDSCFPQDWYVRTPEGWSEYIESEEALKNGHMWLT